MRDIQAFLGIICYITAYLSQLVEYTSVLISLTKKEFDKAFPAWTEHYQAAFDAIKQIVIGWECLTSIDHDSGKNIYVTTNVSDRGTGAVLSVSQTWELARLMAFDSAQYNNAEKNYPVHERELLAIIRALKK